ncbi:hypothetical protein DL96DRAFT_1816593 [Flagelloscypha sp. PMI_526]|nr:hypothetical protein DL96DRAFT_1816593 [Flagelloscypha sp. PMI_526]
MVTPPLMKVSNCLGPNLQTQCRRISTAYSDESANRALLHHTQDVTDVVEHELEEVKEAADDKDVGGVFTLEEDEKPKKKAVKKGKSSKPTTTIPGIIPHFYNVKHKES